MARTTIYHSKTGQAHTCEPVDARDFLASGKWQATDPKAPTPEPEKEPKGPPAALLGAVNLPPVIDLGPRQLPLGDVVAGAHTASGMTVEAWNGLGDVAREKAIVAHVENLKATELAKSLTPGTGAKSK